MTTSAFLRSTLLFCAAALGATLACAEPIVIERETPLQAEPRSDAAVVTTLKQGTQAESLATRGPWLQVKTGTATGWIYSFNARFGSARTSSGGGISALASRLTGGGKPSVTPVIGVRGIDAEDLRNAQFNEAQVAQLERYRVSNEQARSSAAKEGLKAVQINYLDAK